MKSFKLKDIIIPVISLSLICIVVTALLALTNSVTKKPIEENSAKKADEMRRSMFSTAVSFEKRDDYYAALDSGNTEIGYIFETSSKGYGGTVSVMTGIDNDGNICAVEILSHSETPGLGANCTNESFRDDFKQNATDSGVSVVKDGTGGQDGKIDALTGATITSKAVTSAVNDAIDMYKNIKKEGK